MAKSQVTLEDGEGGKPTRGSPRPRPRRLAWLPIPILLAAMGVLWAANLPDSYGSNSLIMALNFIFATLASGLIVYLVSRSFLTRGTPGLLMLGCGVLTWGAAGLVAKVVNQRDANLDVTIHNSCVWLSALFHFAGALLLLRPRRALPARELWLGAAYAGVAGVLGLVVLTALHGFIPTFFVQGAGGTTIRQWVLGSAIAMFLLTAGLLRWSNRRPLSAFLYWYILALCLVALGLFGIMIESVFASMLSWVGLTAQYLGGVYMLIAAIAAVRESGAWHISLEAALRESEQALLRERGLLDSVTKSTDVMLVYLDPAFNFVWVNEAYAQTCKMRPEELVGRNHFALFPHEENEAIFRRVRDTGEAVFWKDKPFEFPDQPERGVTYWDWSLTAVKDGSGKTAGLVFSLRETTKYKLAELALARSEERFRALITATSDVVYRMSPDWSEMRQLRGLGFLADTDEPRRDWLEPYIPSEDQAHVKAVIDEAIRTKSIFELEHRVLRADGTAGWTFSRAIPLLDARGEIIEWFGAASDITERKRAEEQLRRAAAFDEAAMRSLGEGLYTVDDKGLVTSMNPAAEELFGWTFAELRGRKMHDLTHHHYRDGRPFPASECAGFLVLTTGQPLKNHEDVFIRKDGTFFDVIYSITPLRDGEGTIIGLVVVFSDITERIRAEAAMRESEERLNQAIGVASLGIFEHDHRSDVIYYSPRLRGIWGWGDKEPVTLAAILGRVPPEEREALEAHVRSAHDPRGDGLYVVEHRIVRPDGGIRWLSVRSRTFFEGEGAARRAVRTVGAMLDITERKEAEEALKAAKLNAEQASKAKDQFIAVLSHELRNPLNPVLATVSMLQQDSRFDADTREQLEVIHRNVELEARLIDDLLDVTRIERGKIELDRRPIELCTIIHRAAEVCLPDIEARKLEFGIDLGPAPYWVEADAARLQQVFWNLIKNAIKFTPEGGCVGVRCRLADGHVVAEVNDSGEGIAPEVLPRLFSAFEQGGRPVTRQFGGLGLGLTISKAMVEMHGGSIHAYSEGKGKGATFTIRLPLLPLVAAEAAMAATDVPSAAPVAKLAPRPLRILLVEDHGDTARIMRRLLSAQGHKVESAADVATALKLAGEHAFDLLLSDLGLPDGSGLDLMRSLRQSGSTLPGIALSGYGQEQDMQASREVGFAAHLTKPVEIQRLEEVIAEIVGTGS